MRYDFVYGSLVHGHNLQQMMLFNAMIILMMIIIVLTLFSIYFPCPCSNEIFVKNKLWLRFEFLCDNRVTHIQIHVFIIFVISRNGSKSQLAQTILAYSVLAIECIVSMKCWTHLKWTFLYRNHSNVTWKM